MSEDAQAEQTSAAWIRTTQESRALIPRGWSEAPAANALSFFAPDFALNDQRPWLVGDELSDIRDWPARELPPVEHRLDPSASRFHMLHDEILKRIGGGEFTKVVSIVSEGFVMAGPIDAAMFPKSRRPMEDQFAYGFSFDGEGLCGVTPELLFSVKDGVLRTMALAGTGRADGPSLLNDAKECREHNVVVGHLVSELKKFGRIEVDETREQIYGVLKHLRTPIKVELYHSPTFMDLIVRLHPTAALGGYPRKPAVEWLEAQEFHQTRRRFGAPSGYQHNNEMMCVVAIRGVQWRGSHLMIASGCGVVEGSEAAREWLELELKRRTIYSGLDIQL